MKSNLQNPKRKAFIFLCAALVFLSNAAYSSTYVVTNVNDAGAGSLRQAIINANANAGVDIINFNISGAGTKTIMITSLLPIITGPVSINGYTQPGSAQGAIGASRTILIEINGGDVSGRDGFIRFGAAAAGSSLSGISLYNTGSSVEAIQIEAGCSNVHIWGNYIGLLAGGTSPSAAQMNGDDGILLADYAVSTGAFSNIFIGTNGDGTNDAAEGNAIANGAKANGGDGIEIGGAGISYTYTNVRIAGNFIGLAADGTTIAGNGNLSGTNPQGLDGILLLSASNIIIGTNGDGISDALERNVISGNTGHGIDCITSSNTKIAGNYIGVSSAGNAPRPNGNGGLNLDGIYLNTSSGIITGTNGDGVSDALERNIISGNKGHGIDCSSSSDVQIAGNYIGTSADGASAIYNGSFATGQYYGLFINNSSGVIVGFNDAIHTAAAAPNVRNVISGNHTSGIQANNNTSNTNRISGNYIGVSATGNTALGNGQLNLPNPTLEFVAGIDVTGTSNLLIGTDGDGDDDALERNIISGNIDGRGIYFRNSSNNNIVAGNYIGIGANGTTSIGNGFSGIVVDNSSSNRIGSDDNGANDAAEANIIANNARSASGSSDGIRVIGNSTGNRISRNSFYNNNTNPIDLSNDGITVNDGATQSGQPNLLLDYPVINRISLAGTSLTAGGYIGSCNGNEAVGGSLITGPLTVQLYKVADDGDQNGDVTANGCNRSAAHGEGIQYLGSLTTSTGLFSGTFTIASGATFSSTDKLTGITIDAAGNTSEFGVVASLQISGTVFDDGNGLTDNSVNGMGTNAGGTLNAILYDNITGAVAAIVPVAANGTYSFGVAPGGNYSIYLTTNTATPGQAAIPIIALPAGWVTTGEAGNAASGTGSDGNPNSILILGVLNGSSITQANFGIEQIPAANNVTAAAQANPGGTVQVTVPVLNGNDAEDGSYAGTGGTNTILIQTLPANGTLYYNGAPVTTGQIIANYNPALLTVDPVNGNVTVIFTYSEIDAAGVPSVPATVTMPFTSVVTVSILSFEAEKINEHSALITWSTAAEQNSAYFEVERSTDRIAYTSAGRVNATGNSNNEHSYSLTDYRPAYGVNYYRLRMTDNDGHYTTTAVRALNFNGKYNLLLYPNPAHEASTLSGLEAGMHISIISSDGRRAAQHTATASTLTIITAFLAKGIYIVEVSAKNGEAAGRLKLIKE